MTQGRARRLSKRAVADRYGVVPRTVERWAQNPAVDFPRPIVTNKRWYFDEAELDAFDLRQSRTPRTKYFTATNQTEAAA